MARKEETIEVLTYDYWITIKKLLLEAATVGAVSALIYLADVGIPELALEYEQYAILIMTLAAFVRGIANWLKHKDGIEEIIIDADTKEIISTSKIQ